MTRAGWTVAWVLALTAVVVVAALIEGAHRAAIVSAWVLLLAAAVARRLVRTTIGTSVPSAFAEGTVASSGEAVPGLARLERLVVIALSTAPLRGQDPLRPLLGELAADLGLPAPELPDRLTGATLDAALNELETAS